MSVSVAAKSLVPRTIALYLVVIFTVAQTNPSYGATAAPEISRPETVAPTPLNWRNLELHVSGVTASVATRIDLRKRPATEVRATLEDGPKQFSPRAATPRIVELVATNSVRLLLGARFETRDRLWFNEDDGLPLQLTRTRQGSNPSEKIYRFGSDQIYRLRRLPANKAETEQSSEHWSHISESFYPLLDPDRECPTILESSQLLYLLSNPERGVSDSGEMLCVFSRKQVYRVELRTVGQEQLDVEYLQIIAGQETRFRKTLDAVHVVLNSHPFSSAEGDQEPFSFLGLKGEIHVLLSNPGGIPLRVSGQVPGFGMIELELKTLTR